MAFVSVDEYVRLGRKVNGDVHALNHQIDTFGRQNPGKIPGPWWQNWAGFFGSWTQYYAQNVDSATGFPGLNVLPIHDDSDLRQWGKDLDKWRAEFAAKSAWAPGWELGPARTEEIEPKGSGLPGIPDAEEVASFGKMALVIGFMVGAGYLLSGAGSFAGAGARILGRR